MIIINDEIIDKNLLIEIVVPPSIIISDLLNKILVSENNLIFFDSKGNIYEENKFFEERNQLKDEFDIINGSNVYNKNILVKESYKINEKCSEEFNGLNESIMLDENKSLMDEINIPDKSIILIDNNCTNILQNNNLNSQNSLINENNILNKVEKDDFINSNIQNNLIDETSFSDSSQINFSITEEEPLKKYYFISSISSLLKSLNLIKKFSNFILIIDSITIVGDDNINLIKEMQNSLWEIILKCNATIICINHYRIAKIKRTYKMIPRMGVSWQMFLSYRIECTEKNNKISFKIQKFQH